MKVFRVEVEGTFKTSPEGELQSARLEFLVDAHSCDEAFHAGPDVAETVAYMGPKWVKFETVAASPIAFPYMLSDTTQRALRSANNR